MRKWHIHVRGFYLGTVEATEAEVREVFPWAEVFVHGGGVDVWAPPPRRRS